LHFINLNTVFDDDDIDFSQFINFIKKFKSEFEVRFTDFKKIENVVQILNSCFSLHPNGKCNSEATSVFGSTKVALQMLNGNKGIPGRLEFKRKILDEIRLFK